MAVLIASDLAKDMAGEPLLRGVSFKLERRERLTIAGRNGAGKTTLLRMLAGETSVDGGELVLSKGVRVALHDQRPPRDRDRSLRDYVLSGCREPLELEAELTRLEEAMGAGDEAALNRYAGVQARFEAAGGYGWRERARSVVHGLGFTDDDLDRPLTTFSGGQLTRGSLARALAAQPDLLLLDEPTNHLDIESLEWLEKTLLELDAAVVLVAHDRWFLETVGTAVLELEAGRSRFFNGTWHAWRREQAAREMALGRAIEKQEAEIARMERFIERFRYKATKARAAQSRVKKLDKMDRITRDPKDGRALAFSFKPPERSGRVIYELEDARLEVPGRVLIDDAELWLERGEHVSLVGPNGTGKTTLIEALVGRRELDGGRLRSGHNVKVGYLSQHAEELEGGGARTVLEACQKRTGLTPNQARALLGRFLFSGGDAEKPLYGLSGGERRRLSLAILVSSGANVLILDEPTNHLDLESREALEDALRLVRGLAAARHARPRAARRRRHADGRRRGSRAALLHGRLGGVRAHPRGAQGARRVARLGRAAPGARAEAGQGRQGGRRAEARARPTATAGRRRTAVASRSASSAPSSRPRRDLAALEEELADPRSWATKYESAKSTARHTAAKRAVEDAYARLEAFEASAPAG